MPDFHAVANIEDIPLNKVKLIELDGVELLLCRTADQVHVIENKCSHQDKPLANGRIRNGYILCPFHGMRYKLEDGEPVGQLTRIPLRTFKSRIVDGNVEVSTNPRD